MGLSKLQKLQVSSRVETFEETYFVEKLKLISHIFSKIEQKDETFAKSFSAGLDCQKPI